MRNVSSYTLVYSTQISMEKRSAHVIITCFCRFSSAVVPVPTRKTPSDQRLFGAIVGVILTGLILVIIVLTVVIIRSVSTVPLPVIGHLFLMGFCVSCSGSVSSRRLRVTLQSRKITSIPSQCEMCTVSVSNFFHV